MIVGQETELAAVLSADGPLQRAVAGYRSRPEQLAMAEAVAAALDSGATLICEAGTGTGKTLAYLLPAVLSGRKILISTATRTLQDQLYARELPALRGALQLPFSAALLKGRGNYLCHHRLERAAGELGADRRLQHQRQLIEEWTHRTRWGDTAELAEVPEDSDVWPQVTSTADNCLGQECPWFDDCFVVKARRRAQDSDIVVVNHHLLLADMALREEGFGELLPGVDAVIVDEAHQLPDIASGFFGVTLSSRQLHELARDAILARAEEAREADAIDHAAQRLETAASRLRLSLGNGAGRQSWEALRERRAVGEALDELDAALAGLHGELERHAERGKRLSAGRRRSVELRRRLGQFQDLQDEEQPQVRWIELRGRGLLMHTTPVELGSEFQRRAAGYDAGWIFTSATLAVAGRFDHFERQLGIADAERALWISPYDYQRKSLLYLPAIPVEPRHPEYLRLFLEASAQVLAASRGRAFLLFTSHRALNEAQAILAEQLEFPLFVQGRAPRSVLLDRFRESNNGVLLGTSSFWEGVDVRGPALSCVIIDKLPFAAPDDPVLQARARALAERGGNPFRDDQLPAAVIALKQGAGRLIRDENDRGVLMIGDPRIRTRSYGRAFLDSLPPMPRSDDIDEVRAFFA